MDGRAQDRGLASERVRPAAIPAAVDRAAALFGHRVAVVDGSVRWSWDDLRTRARAVAGHLIAAGIEHGDRVAIWAPNNAHWVASALGILYSGAVLVPINTRFTAVEAADVITRSGARALMVGDRFLGVDRLARLRQLPAQGDTAGPVAALPAISSVLTLPLDADVEPHLAGTSATTGDIDGRAQAVHPDDVSDILFTSGTSGRSKGAMSAHRQALAAAAAWADNFEITPDDRYLGINPFFHSFGYKAGILVCLLTGATLFPQAVFDPDGVLRVVEAERITVLPGPPAVFQTLLDHPARTGHESGSLRLAVTGADIVPEVLVERMRGELGFDEVLTAYGLTEAVVATLCRPGDDVRVVAHTSGRPAPGMEVRIADRSGRPLPVGATGEVYLRGPNVMLGYLDDEAATEKAIDADGWLHTGDVGVLDDDGNLRITDRLKDMYISGGFNVYPAEVERELAGLDGVGEVAVIGVPDARLGHVGKAFIVPRPGARLSIEAVLTYCAENLANYKRPRHLEFCDALPRNASGKVVKRLLAG